MISRETIRANLPVAAAPGIPEIRLHQAGPRSGLGRMGAAVPYWAHCWGGGLALAKYVLHNPEIVCGKCVLDLGAGSGLVAIAAMRAGAAQALAADSDENALAAIALNAAQNGVAVTMLSGDRLDGAPPAVDLVLVGDLFYDTTLAQRASAFLDRCLIAEIPVLIGDPWRKPLPLRRLRLLADYRVQDFGAAEPVRGSVFAYLAADNDAREPADAALAML